MSKSKAKKQQHKLPTWKKIDKHLDDIAAAWETSMRVLYILQYHGRSTTKQDELIAAFETYNLSVIAAVHMRVKEDASSTLRHFATLQKMNKVVASIRALREQLEAGAYPDPLPLTIERIGTDKRGRSA